MKDGRFSVGPDAAVTIGDRLRRERARLNMSQHEFGLIGGVQTDAQYKYERGLRIPKADYLAALAKIGVDILYVVTGTNAPMSPTDAAKKSARS
ncbi:XRE family transcriptional regulator [Pseudomonas sp. PB103]|uniref:helix-turn-helix domain-containing protein n=1 Tax=Pseudomonas sp. PB103 TaxID=2494698 RepID=UPI00131D5B3D|nr:XRE family transcriptional regulator [Pseudomonas sp. PB103]